MSSLHLFCLYSCVSVKVIQSSHVQVQCHYAAFHLVFTVCKSTRLGVSRIQRVKQKQAVSSLHLFCLYNCVSVKVIQSSHVQVQCHYAAFHLVFTVCKSTRLGVCRIQRNKQKQAVSSLHLFCLYSCVSVKVIQSSHVQVQCHYAAFHLVFTVCKSTRLWVS